MPSIRTDHPIDEDNPNWRISQALVQKEIKIGIAAALAGLKRGTVWVDNNPREVVYLPVSIVAESQTVTEFEAGL
jgi:multisubunit Na+/H+ antiporter MnhE subunit